MPLCEFVSMVRKLGEVVNLSKSVRCGHSIAEHKARDVVLFLSNTMRKIRVLENAGFSFHAPILR